ncbi:MAG: flavin reductase family protein [Dehalococcoidia bacterium]|nr:flavin reductase family protein [Dehalococcoidia bacterium]
MLTAKHEGAGNYHYHFPSSAVIVTARHEGKENAMTAAWHAPFSFSPPYYGVLISPRRFTFQLINSSRQFGINFMPLEQAELAAAVGGSKGAEVNKFEKYNIKKDSPVKTSVPIIKTAYAAYECSLVDSKTYGDHELFVGEIVAVHFDQKAFPGKGLDLSSGVAPLLYLGGENYSSTDKNITRFVDRQIYGQ